MNASASDHFSVLLGNQRGVRPDHAASPHSEALGAQLWDPADQTNPSGLGFSARALLLEQLRAGDPEPAVAALNFASGRVEQNWREQFPHPAAVCGQLAAEAAAPYAARAGALVDALHTELALTALPSLAHSYLTATLRRAADSAAGEALVAGTVSYAQLTDTCQSRWVNDWLTVTAASVTRENDQAVRSLKLPVCALTDDAWRECLSVWFSCQQSGDPTHALGELRVHVAAAAGLPVP